MCKHGPTEKNKGNEKIDNFQVKKKTSRKIFIKAKTKINIFQLVLKHPIIDANSKEKTQIKNDIVPQDQNGFLNRVQNVKEVLDVQLHMPAFHLQL